jgi:DNA-binding TFAR19-related protein (PDSD5 family)
MAIPLHEFVRRRQEENADADRRARNQPPLIGDRVIAARLDALAETAVSGGQDVDVQLAALLSQIPQDKRDEAVATFRARVQALEEKQEPSMPTAPLTPEQERLMQQMKEHEQGIIAHMLHEKTREKIRRLFLFNPGLWGQVKNISEELHKRGIIGIGSRAADEIAPPAAQNIPATERKKDPERER